MKYSNYSNKLSTVLASIEKEVSRAKTIFPDDFVNQHEAYAVLLEEVGELWNEPKKEPDCKNTDIIIR